MLGWNFCPWCGHRIYQHGPQGCEHVENVRRWCEGDCPPGAAVLIPTGPPPPMAVTGHAHAHAVPCDCDVPLGVLGAGPYAAAAHAARPTATAAGQPTEGNPTK